MSEDDKDDQPPAEDRTIFSPATTPPVSAAPPEPPQPTGFAPAASPSEPRSIQIGDVLNHIFEVRRFIARGGMGEVFEGVNVNSDERVAIKVILPHLAADPAVQAMFRKEARTLTRLGHPALVQYRVLAQEPSLGVFYIVTEYIEGQNLSDILRDLKPSPADLAMLTKRLADGLAAAHALGAIHRDISPDNVLIEDGRLDRAKIIDFGIAKDLDASTGTIVGDGFAGKLNYVAPEQLGDFDREVGPWTDVYSLGLLILAVAMGKDVNMGGSLVDAVDKRRAGPDLSPLPEQLRPVLEKMLRPNPADRARSMEEVLQLLANPAPAAAPAPTAPPRRAAKAPRAPGTGETGKRLPPRTMLIGGGALGVLVLAGVLLWAFSGGKEKPAEPSGAETAAATGPAAPADPVAAARQLIDGGLPSVSCAWLDVVDVSAQGTSISASFRGVAGKPAEAQQQISRLLDARGLQAATINFSDVSPINATECGAIESFRKVRDFNAAHLTVPQRSFELGKLGPDAGPDAGKLGATAVIDVDLNGLSDDLALVGIEESGEMTEFISKKTDLTQNPQIQQVRPGVYRIQLSTTHNGWSGILMLSGKPPFSETLLSGPPGSRGADWSTRFSQTAQQQGWKSEMVWYRTVDQTPG